MRWRQASCRVLHFLQGSWWWAGTKWISPFRVQGRGWWGDNELSWEICLCRDWEMSTDPNNGAELRWETLGRWGGEGAGCSCFYIRGLGSGIPHAGICMGQGFSLKCGDATRWVLSVARFGLSCWNSMVGSLVLTNGSAAPLLCSFVTLFFLLCALGPPKMSPEEDDLTLGMQQISEVIFNWQIWCIVLGYFKVLVWPVPFSSD